MWLMTKHGFYSIVQKEPGKYHIRSREPQDLENLVDRVPLPQVEIYDTPSRDYAARLIVDQQILMLILEFLGNTVDYDNFKDCIANTADQAHKPYHEIWGILAQMLGAYGRSGRFQRKK
jgi:hypothetical protein